VFSSSGLHGLTGNETLDFGPLVIMFTATSYQATCTAAILFKTQNLFTQRNSYEYAATTKQ